MVEIGMGVAKEFFLLIIAPPIFSQNSYFYDLSGNRQSRTFTLPHRIISASMGFGFGSNLSSIVLGCSFSVTYAYNDFSFTAGLRVSDNVVGGGARAKYKGYGGGYYLTYYGEAIAPNEIASK